MSFPRKMCETHTSMFFVGIIGVRKQDWDQSWVLSLNCNSIAIGIPIGVSGE